MNSTATNFTGTLEVNGDLEWNRKAWGQMTYHNDTTPITVAITDNTRHFPITGMNNSLAKEVTSNTTHFTIKHTGTYRIGASVSFGGNANQEYQMSILRNATSLTYCEAHRKMGTGGDVGNAGINCLYNLVQGDKLAIGIQDETLPVASASVYSVHFNIERID